MARLPRIALPGHAHHVVQRGHNRQAIVLDDVDRQHWRQVLADAFQDGTDGPPRDAAKRAALPPEPELWAALGEGPGHDRPKSATGPCEEDAASSEVEQRIGHRGQAVPLRGVRHLGRCRQRKHQRRYRGD